jgi:uncharacterized protein (TIGR02246 family)
MTSPATLHATSVIEQLEQAWNAADGAAFGAEFADEADFVDIRGGHHRGAAAIAHGHQALFDSIYAGSRVSYALEVARPVASGGVLAVVGATLDAPHGPMQGTHRARFTMVIADDGVTAFHNTLVTG